VRGGRPPYQRPTKHAPALRSHGRACGAAFGATPGARTSVSRGIVSLPLQFRHVTEFGTVRSSQYPPGARLRAITIRTTKTFTYVATGPIRHDAVREQQQVIRTRCHLDFAHCGTRKSELGLRRLALNAIFPPRLPPEMPVLLRLSTDVSDQGA